ncbi:3-oxoadipate enol-lactonase [Paraburkholderia caballeronis]|uniref:3-oxoadipate enol-lactonase n=1 Tax=Paraburkholderia caballeronis TaxID=416943 RepID=UPI001064D1F4|nr:3-oxoadipate enol-lactonase [Paraburkholderia caballeronis]TDV18516.1 3-oxoadipate enol-lactonase [Paraburkholderia caballeronis]TDV19946.1 3-oxoadipate enol-lactonase [Paraburkholderia caballeronis]TDV28163.1 3-oxoadipate enol-lactonase [Paraburkholderia caballeronis]TDV37147.1 3-oxoadipate enol-lactonase [Paraburkholderia caballeronis]
MQVTVNGIDTRYVLDDESGGPWLTFVHQLGGDLSVWDQLAGHFRHQYTVMRYDVRGHGSTAVSPNPFSIADLTADLNTLLDALGATNTHLVGLSMGGMIAQRFALDRPSRVASLTLADTASRTPQDARPMWEQRAAMVRRDGIAAIADATLDRWLTADFRHRHPEAVEQICDVLLRTSSEGYAMACDALREFDAHEALRDLRVRTLAVAGRHDTGTPPAATKALADAIGGAQFEMLDAAHLAPVEEAHRFAALLETFLHPRV